MGDWTQAGLYAAGLAEPIPMSCGPQEPQLADAIPTQRRGVTLMSPSASSLRLLTASGAKGDDVEAIVTLGGVGTENALGFSLEFDASVLRFVGASPGEGATDAVLQVNDRRAESGRVGVAIARGIGEAFPAGALELVRLHFVVLVSTGTAPIEFIDQPIVREVVDSVASVLPASYESGAIEIVDLPRIVGVQQLEQGGIKLEFRVQGTGSWVLEVSIDLDSWLPVESVTAIDGVAHFVDESPTEWGRRFFRLRREP